MTQILPLLLYFVVWAALAVWAEERLHRPGYFNHPELMHGWLGAFLAFSGKFEILWNSPTWSSPGTELLRAGVVTGVMLLLVQYAAYRTELQMLRRHLDVREWRMLLRFYRSRAGIILLPYVCWALLELGDFSVLIFLLVVQTPDLLKYLRRRGGQLRFSSRWLELPGSPLAAEILSILPEIPRRWLRISPKVWVWPSASPTTADDKWLEVHSARLRFTAAQHVVTLPASLLRRFDTPELTAAISARVYGFAYGYEQWGKRAAPRTIRTPADYLRAVGTVDAWLNGYPDLESFWIQYTSTRAVRVFARQRLVQLEWKQLSSVGE